MSAQAGKARKSNKTLLVKCQRCGRMQSEARYYRYNGRQERVPECRECFVRGVRNNDPSTILPLLEVLDYPWVERKWVELANKKYVANPTKFCETSVFGDYVKNMAMKRSRGYRFKDSEALGESMYGTTEFQEERKADLREKLAAGVIDHDEYVAMTGEGMTCDIVPDNTYAIVDPLKAGKGNSTSAGMTKSVVANAAAIANPLKAASMAPTMTPQTPIPSPLGPEPEPQADAAPAPPPSPVDDGESVIRSQLTAEDVRRLSVKWGVMYKPSEWVKMEEMYQQYASEYEMSVDREQVLRNICKCSLKMDEALDVGDIKTYRDLSATFDSMRKSGRFTEAQKTEDSKREIDSLGELVAYVEQAKGPIKREVDPIEEPQDKIDFIIRDMKHYVDTLVREDLGLGDLIETYIKKSDRQRMSDVSQIMSEGFSSVPQEVLDYQRSFQDSVAREVQEQAERLAAGGLNPDGTF